MKDETAKEVARLVGQDPALRASLLEWFRRNGTGSWDEWLDRIVRNAGDEASFGLSREPESREMLRAVRFQTAGDPDVAAAAENATRLDGVDRTDVCFYVEEGRECESVWISCAAPDAARAAADYVSAELRRLGWEAGTLPGDDSTETTVMASRPFFRPGEPVPEQAVR